MLRCVPRAHPAPRPPPLQVPVLVVTANSRHNLEPERTSVRFMALVEGHARNMLQWACKSLIDGKRSDKLLLAQVRGCWVHGLRKGYIYR